MRFLNGNGKDHRNETVRLADLVGDDGVLEGHRFFECEVKGPAVMVVQGEFNLVNNRIGGDPDAFLWELPPDRERVTGAVLVKDTTFEGCTFTNVGLAGYQEFIEQVRQGLATPHAFS